MKIFDRISKRMQICCEALACMGYNSYDLAVNINSFNGAKIIQYNK